MGAPRVKLAVVNFSSSGDNTVVTAASAGPINIVGIAFTVHAATNITFKNGGTAQSGAIELTGAGSALTLPVSDSPWYYADPGNNFVINSSNAVQVSGTVWYTNG